MPSKIKNSKLVFETQCSTLSSGVKALPEATFTVDGVVTPKADLVTPLDAYGAAESEVTATHAAYQAAVQKAHAAESAARVVVEKLKPYLKVRFGKSNPVLESTYGIAPAKPRKVKVAVKAASVTKAAATRKAKKPAPAPAAPKA